MLEKNSAVEAPAQRRSEAAHRHGQAALIDSALSVVLLVAILILSPERLPSYELAMVAVSVALMAGLLSMFLSGKILVRMTGTPRTWHQAVEAGGGLVVVVFVLGWWPGPALQQETTAVSQADTDTKTESDATKPA